MPISPPRTAAAVLTALLVATLAAAQQRAPSAPATPPEAGVEELDARAVRERLRELMQRFPPELARVLKMDPSLLRNESYLAQYPALARFLAAHPEIAHNPSFYFQFADTRAFGWEPLDARTETVRMWRNLMEGVAAASIFITVAGLIAWFVRTFIDYRRWLRVSRVQTEVHNKLLERFAGSGDLVAYLQSPAGRRFLESAPIPLDPAPRSLAAPLGRVLWAVQGGVVFLAVGIGLQFVSGRLIDEIGQPLGVLGVLAIALGLGLIASGGVAYILSRRFGLLEPPSSTAEQQDAPPA